MPAKISGICYVHESTDRLTQEFTVKEITTVSRLDPDDPTKVVYLKKLILWLIMRCAVCKGISFCKNPVKKKFFFMAE